MKFLRWLNLIAVFSFLTACGSASAAVTPTASPQLTPLPIVTVASAPDPALTLTAYLDAFKADDYNAMYGMLSKVAQSKDKSAMRFDYGRYRSLRSARSIER